MIVKCQLWVDNDLFKVVEFPDVRPEIYYALPEAYMGITPTEVTLESLSKCSLNKLIFRLEGIVERRDDVIVAKYRYAGGSE